MRFVCGQDASEFYLIITFKAVCSHVSYLNETIRSILQTIHAIKWSNRLRLKCVKCQKPLRYRFIVICISIESRPISASYDCYQPLKNIINRPTNMDNIPKNWIRPSIDANGDPARLNLTLKESTVTVIISRAFRKNQWPYAKRFKSNENCFSTNPILDFWFIVQTRFNF